MDKLKHDKDCRHCQPGKRGPRSYRRAMYHHKSIHGIRRHDIEQFHSRMKLIRPVAIVVNIIFIALLIHFTGITPLVIVFAVIFMTREVFQVLFMLRLQRRILEPVGELKQGIEAVSEGNFDVVLETNVNNEFAMLFEAFNTMSSELGQMNQVKAEYEENRKNLIANITHDIKTPLASIQGYMETINEGAVTDPETLKRYNEIILNNVVYTNKLINDLFLFSKLDMDKIAFEFKEVHAKAFFRDMMEEMGFEVKELGYTWLYEDELHEDVILAVDGKRIYQSMRNIIGNAIKYGAKDDLKIIASVRLDHGHCIVNIIDNGPGIGPEHLAHIFKRFYRIDQARTKDTMSTGLGLAISKEFIEAHDGRIEIESREGLGTSIRIALPYQEGFDEKDTNH